MSMAIILPCAEIACRCDFTICGEEVIVTDRGKPVARIAPISGPEETESRLWMLVRTGQVRPPDVEGGIDLELIAALRPRVPCAGVVDALLEERREGR